MRSFTSVLSNILGSHDEIAGYSESHQSYEKPIDLFRLKYIVCLCNENHCVGRYVLDKILHNEFSINKTILERENEKIYVFEKVKKLRSTEINQAKLTLDPMITPSVTKTERFYFTVQKGVIVKAKKEEEYER